jgi:hypothetical protein
MGNLMNLKNYISAPNVELEFLYDEFDVPAITPTISRAVESAGWSKKAARRVAQERNVDLRDFYP